jgi:hypothetical protein
MCCQSLLAALHSDLQWLHIFDVVQVMRVLDQAQGTAVCGALTAKMLWDEHNVQCI